MIKNTLNAKILTSCTLFATVSSLFSATTSVPIDLFVTLLPENPIIVEAGAQFGEDTKWMSTLWEKGTIYAFEPSPFSYPSLKELSEKRLNVLSFPLALSNQSGMMPLYIAGGASSLLIPEDSFNNTYFHADISNPSWVPVVKLDDWLEVQGVSHVDFLWLDMEGNELNALEGLERHLDHVKLIYTEVNLQNFWKRCVLYEDLKGWLESKGFKEIWCEMVFGWQGNALFLNVNANNLEDIK